MDRLLVADLAANSQIWALNEESERRLRTQAPDGWRVHVIKAQTNSDGDGPPRPSDEVMAAIRDAEIYFGFGMPRALLLEAKKLRWVHSASAGVGGVLYPEMVASDVLLSNSAGIYGVPIAEHIVAAIMYFLRGFDYATEQQARREWSKAPFVRLDSVVREMDTVRALIIGTGGIGQEAGRRLTALGARCTGLRRRVELGAPPGFERVIGVDQLDGELPAHDVIVLAAPLTSDTAGLLTAARLDRLPPTAIIVNVGRGALVDEAALIERLGDGRIRGAALDVFQDEPLAPSSPLWQLRQVLVTPHVSGVSPGRFWPRQLDLFFENWGRYLGEMSW